MNSILETRSQLLAQLRSINFVHQSSALEMYNLNANSWPVVKAVIATGLYPNLAYPMNGYLANRLVAVLILSYLLHISQCTLQGDILRLGNAKMVVVKKGDTGDIILSKIKVNP